jgi:hypothetical protein
MQGSDSIFLIDHMGSLIGLMFLSQEAAMGSESIEIGRTYTIGSSASGCSRCIQVYLPVEYGESDRRYPVVYVLDSSATRLAWAASCMEILDGMGRMPCSIIVGIQCTDGFRDYFPEPMENRPGSGNLADFLRCITDEIRPWVDDSFRTCGFDVLCGFSNSGMFTVHTALCSPSSFSAYIAGSPSLGWFPELFRSLAIRVLDEGLPRGFSLYMNWSTDDLERIVSSAMPDFVEIFRNRAGSGVEWMAEILTGAGHVPYSTLRRGFESIFKGWSYPARDLIQGGLQGLLEHYSGLEAQYGIPVKIPQGAFMDLGHGILSGGNHEEALAVFRMYAGEYPGSHRAHFFLGVCQMALGDGEGAGLSWNRALELEPGFSPARRRLDSLET